MTFSEAVPKNERTIDVTRINVGDLANLPGEGRRKESASHVSVRDLHAAEPYIAEGAGAGHLAGARSEYWPHGGYLGKSYTVGATTTDSAASRLRGRLDSLRSTIRSEHLIKRPSPAAGHHAASLKAKRGVLDNSLDATK